MLTLGLITADLNWPKMKEGRMYLSLLVTPLQWLVDIPSRAADSLSDLFVDRAALIRDNEQLRAEALELHRKSLRMESLAEENRQLRELLNAQQRLEPEVRAVELIGINPDPFLHEVILNRGSEDGLKIGQPVIDAGGIMGQVLSLAHYTSRVMLITDARTAIPVEVNRSGFRSIALGKGVLNELELSHVPSTADIEEGDLLVTSGLGGRFPRGYPVAVVEEIIRDPGRPFLLVKARPSARLDRSRQLLLIDYSEAHTTQSMASETDAVVEEP
ncbi:Rod shape-determining protein MreC [Nitrincola lacisaponensis]|uniref:Cell shape-determining protein MreC n=1 Tax=Nitrincola lacisaponensis TaxID=267850 RepID=A0A063Y512_9GAMM|nr:Rod shape-determining protein MreC [Nitrincola lacisaponensis]